MGVRIYKAVFALASLTGILLIGSGYSAMDYYELWPPPVWAGHLALVVMPMVIILWVAAELKGHIRQKLKHPMVIGVLLWAMIHLINNGDRASLYLFGAFAVYSVFSIISTTRRGKIPKYTQAKVSHDIIAVVVGMALSGVMIHGGHEFLFGVAPLF
jgi:uncharacterized membrane protein